MTDQTSTTRAKTTPAERAQDALDVAQRRLDKAKVRRNNLREAFNKADDEVGKLVLRRDYLAQSPDLPADDDVPDAEIADEES